MKLAILTLASALLFASGAVADVTTLLSPKEESYGFTGTIDNNVGALTGAQVLYVKLQRSVVLLPGNQARIDVRYPEIPAEARKIYKFPQAGSYFDCGLSAEAKAKGVKLLGVEGFQNVFRDLRAGADQRLFNLGLPEGEDRICAVTVDLGDSGADVGQLGSWTTSGLPPLTLNTRQYQEKKFIDIAPPYIRFLKAGEATFNTDDEFWFLLSASVYREPTLIDGFLSSDAGYIDNWIKDFAFNIVGQVGNVEYFDELHRRFGYPSQINKTYTIPVESKEVEHEL